MKSVFVLSSLLALAVALPQQGIPGTFQDPSGNKQHLLPQSFFTPGQQIQAELRNANGAPAASAQQPQQPVNLQAQAPVPAQTQANAESQDSYSNIGGVSGRVASALTNTNEYGETLPQAFSNLQQDSYAYYQQNNQN